MKRMVRCEILIGYASAILCQCSSNKYGIIKLCKLMHLFYLFVCKRIKSLYLHTI